MRWPGESTWKQNKVKCSLPVLGISTSTVFFLISTIIRTNLDNGNQVGQWIEQDHKNGFMGVIQSVFVLVKSKPLSYFQFFFSEEIPLPDKGNWTGQVAGKRHQFLN